MSEKLQLLIHAGHPLISIESTDEDRALAQRSAGGTAFRSGAGGWS